MDPLMSFLQTAAIVVAGLALRFLVALVGLVLLVLPIVAVLELVRLSQRLYSGGRGTAPAGHLQWLRQIYYAPGHTWVAEASTSSLRVGIDDLAQRLLTGARAVRVVEPGTALRRGDLLAEVDLGGRKARIVAPVDGLVMGVNDEVVANPDLVHTEPYRRGWLALVAPTGSEYRGLRTGAAARRWLVEEDQRLSVFFESRLGLAAADGGEYVLPPPALLAPEQWDEAVQLFLTPRA
jgi:glycine cleavage system H lipoate-binding protein